MRAPPFADWLETDDGRDAIGDLTCGPVSPLGAEVALRAAFQAGMRFQADVTLAESPTGSVKPARHGTSLPEDCVFAARERLDLIIAILEMPYPADEMTEGCGFFCGQRERNEE